MAADDDTLLEVSDLRVAFERQVILENLSLRPGGPTPFRKYTASGQGDTESGRTGAENPPEEAA